MMPRYKLRTLLILMAWLGVVLVALREPTEFWSGAVALFTLLAVLIEVLVAIHSKHLVRTRAVGFIVFSVGFLLYVAIVARGYSDGLTSGFADSRTPTPLFELLHPEERVDLAVGGEMLLPPPYEARYFLSICNHAMAFLFGVAGAIIADRLHNSAEKEGINRGHKTSRNYFPSSWRCNKNSVRFFAQTAMYIWGTRCAYDSPRPWSQALKYR